MEPPPAAPPSALEQLQAFERENSRFFFFLAELQTFKLQVSTDNDDWIAELTAKSLEYRQRLTADINAFLSEYAANLELQEIQEANPDKSELEVFQLLTRTRPLTPEEQQAIVQSNDFVNQFALRQAFADEISQPSVIARVRALYTDPSENARIQELFAQRKTLQDAAAAEQQQQQQQEAEKKKLSPSVVYTSVKTKYGYQIRVYDLIQEWKVDPAQPGSETTLQAKISEFAVDVARRDETYFTEFLQKKNEARIAKNEAPLAGLMEADKVKERRSQAYLELLLNDWRAAKDVLTKPDFVSKQYQTWLTPERAAQVEAWRKEVAEALASKLAAASQPRAPRDKPAPRAAKRAAPPADPPADPSDTADPPAAAGASSAPNPPAAAADSSSAPAAADAADAADGTPQGEAKKTKSASVEYTRLKNLNGYRILAYDLVTSVWKVDITREGWGDALTQKIQEFKRDFQEKEEAYFDSFLKRKNESLAKKGLPSLSELSENEKRLERRSQLYQDSLLDEYRLITQLFDKPSFIQTDVPKMFAPGAEEAIEALRVELQQALTAKTESSKERKVTNVTIERFERSFDELDAIFRKDFPGITAEQITDLMQVMEALKREKESYLERSGALNVEWRIERGIEIEEDYLQMKATFADNPSNVFPLQTAWREYVKSSGLDKVIMHATYVRLQKLDAAQKASAEAKRKAVQKLATEASQYTSRGEPVPQDLVEKLEAARVESQTLSSESKRLFDDFIQRKLADYDVAYREIERKLEAEREEANQKRKAERDAERDAARADAEAANQAAKEAKAKQRAAEREAKRLEKAGDKAAARAAAAKQKQLKEEAKTAALDAKRKGRKARTVDSQVNAYGTASTQASLLAISLGTFDAEETRLQKLFDQKYDDKLLLDCEEVVKKFDWMGGMEDRVLPPQPLERRTRTFGGKDADWPVTQVAFTAAQHTLLFVDGGIMLKKESPAAAAEEEEEEEDDDAAEDTTTTPTPVPTPIALSACIEESNDNNDNDLSDLANGVDGVSLHGIHSSDVGAPAAGKAKATTKTKATSKAKGKALNEAQEEARERLVQALTEEEVVDADPILFNKPYARCLLAEHLRSLQKQYIDSLNFNKKALFVNLPAALGPITVNANDANSGIDEARLAETVDALLPSLESMLRYRNTILKVKEAELRNELELIGETRPSLKAKSLKTLKDLEKLQVDAAWGLIPARRLLMGERGQLPGQLASPQPMFLPLRISAPPRIGKSATALLAASLAKRVGMTSMYSVHPNKKAPIAELTAKLTRIGWRSEDDARAASDAADAAYGNSRGTLEYACTNMRYNWRIIDDVDKKRGVSFCNVDGRSQLDMVIYSSDIVGDVARAGALLANWRRSTTVVFHIRDEAQSLAKEENNKFATCQREFLAPPPELNFLRYYFGNLYGISCLVTATLFPTLLEPNLWGFFGSTAQNVRAGLPLAAPVNAIKQTLGASFLPKLVPAIRAYKSPGYMGVSHLKTWVYPAAVAGEPKLGTRDNQLSFSNGELQWKVTPRAAGEEATLAYSANFSGILYEETAEYLFELQRAAATARRTRERRRETAPSQAEAQYEEARRRSARNARRTPAQVLMGENETNEDNSTGGGGGGGGGGGDNSDEDSDDEDYQDETTRKRKTLTGEEKRTFDRQLVSADQQTISMHFLDWLTSSKEVTIASLRAADEPAANSQPSDATTTLMPMYLGALNQNVADDAMVSFVRLFAELAHERTKQARAKGIVTTKAEYGVTFILFTASFPNRRALEESGGEVRLANNEGEELKEVSRVDSAQGAGSFVPCEAPPTDPSFNAVTFVYDPEHPTNAATNATAQAPKGKPGLFVFLGANAQVSIGVVNQEYGISKIALLGYSMLSAGLTVQHVESNMPVYEETGRAGTRSGGAAAARRQVGTYTRIYAPQYVALGTPRNAALDKQLQTAGRSFVELKNMVAPQGWEIQFLGANRMVERLQTYSKMEELLADVGHGASRKMPMYEALKTQFNSSLVASDEFGDLGVVGVRRGNFASMLGLTAEVAARRAEAARRAREKAEAKGLKDATQAELDQLAQEALEEVNEERKQSDAAALAQAAEDREDGAGAEGGADDDDDTASEASFVTNQTTTPTPTPNRPKRSADEAGSSSSSDAAASNNANDNADDNEEQARVYQRLESDGSGSSKGNHKLLAAHVCRILDGKSLRQRLEQGDPVAHAQAKRLVGLLRYV